MKKLTKKDEAQTSETTGCPQCGKEDKEKNRVWVINHGTKFFGACFHCESIYSWDEETDVEPT